MDICYSYFSLHLLIKSSLRLLLFVSPFLLVDVRVTGCHPFPFAQTLHYMVTTSLRHCSHFLCFLLYLLSLIIQVARLRHFGAAGHLEALTRARRPKLVASASVCSILHFRVLSLCKRE